MGSRTPYRLLGYVLLYLATTASSCEECPHICLTAYFDQNDPEIAAVSRVTIHVSGAEQWEHVLLLGDDQVKAGRARLQYDGVVYNGAPLSFTFTGYDEQRRPRALGRVETTATKGQILNFPVVSSAQ